MKTNFPVIGIFVVVALSLFCGGLFMIGDRHKAFSHHVDFYTEISDVNGITPGSKVRVSGFDAGQVESLQIPDSPSGKFRIKLHIDDKLRKLIRQNSVVTVESDGIVGDKFLLIHNGTDQSEEASNGATLAGKEPIEISAVIEKVSGVVDQASSTIVDVRGKLNVALDSAATTINNVNGLVTDVRGGKGSIGVLLNDPVTAQKLKQTVSNAQQASANINELTVHAGQLMSDVQTRNLPAKIDDTIVSARHAAQQADQAAAQINQASQQVNTTLTAALGPDRSGENAGENIRESLSNVNLATANIADDTEALKHGFLFRGYFKKRGFYSLQELSPEAYRKSEYFQRPANHRFWLDALSAFATNDHGSEVLTAIGEQQLDQIMGDMKDQVVDEPIVIEGYSNQVSAAAQITASRSRALLVAHYVQKRYHLRGQDVGVVPLNATPPESSGKSSWDGVGIVLISEKK